MKQLLVVYHSQSGRTAQLAAAVAEGARQEVGVSVRVLPASEAGAGDWLGSDLLVLGSPECAGYLSGGMKDFLDRCFYAVQERAGMPYASFASAGNDGRNAIAQIDRILSGCRMKPVAEPVIVRGEPDPAALQACRELGQGLAVGLGLGIF